MEQKPKQSTEKSLKRSVVRRGDSFPQNKFSNRKFLKDKILHLNN
jgi:hypothetical protein